MITMSVRVGAVSWTAITNRQSWEGLYAAGQLEEKDWQVALTEVEKTIDDNWPGQAGKDLMLYVSFQINTEKQKTRSTVSENTN